MVCIMAYGGSYMSAFLGLLLAQPADAQADATLSKMAALYEDICLDAFPDAGKAEARILALGAIELSPEVVKVTMRDDPARGWGFEDGSATIWLEFPPFYACSVRWNMPDMGDLSPYRDAVEAYAKTNAGFAPMDPMDVDQGDIHIQLTGEARDLSNGTKETLFMVVQNIRNEERRAAGETGLVVRFVHQIMVPSAEAR
ncbi:hypothetical protein [Novosphingopyxis sp.]|uniref:hypothetical protein n=1 Tax=Novosphingopyxis sp. TaxID=2709690 RepID=UPI003B5C588E